MEREIGGNGIERSKESGQAESSLWKRVASIAQLGRNDVETGTAAEGSEKGRHVRPFLNPILSHSRNGILCTILKATPNSKLPINVRLKHPDQSIFALKHPSSACQYPHLQTLSLTATTHSYPPLIQVSQAREQENVHSIPRS